MILALDIGVDSCQAQISGIDCSRKISTQDFRLVKSRWFCKRHVTNHWKENFSESACKMVCL